jgi:hypothetical protein
MARGSSRSGVLLAALLLLLLLLIPLLVVVVVVVVVALSVVPVIPGARWFGFWAGRAGGTVTSARSARWWRRCARYGCSTVV